MKKIFSVIFIGFLSMTLFAQIKILSPIEGIFANKQMLIIENDDGGDYYYSLNGSDPETFGFAYDGPVLIDLDGEVELKITKAGKKKQEASVNYSVIPDSALNKDYYEFISYFYESGIINYTSGTTFSIPSNLKYSFGLPPDSYNQGTDLYISDSSILSRYIPCTILDEETGKKWRFIVRTFPQKAGIYSKRDVPFYITDWDTVTFTNNNFIYKIDSSMWELPNSSKQLDRSVNHIIYWQNLDYNQDNPVEFFVLPPKPELKKEEMEDGCILFSLIGDDSYSLSVLDENQKDYQELFPQLGIDTFYGDNVSGTLKIGFFSNSIYQGSVEVPFSINKRPPSMPIIKGQNSFFYSREPVEVTIKGEAYSDLYYSISSPYKIENAYETYTTDSVIFENVEMKPFEKASSDTVSLQLEPDTEGAFYYKVQAYSKNGENYGQTATYSVIIDQYNFYYEENADLLAADGTSLHPYGSFEQCMQAINNGKYACLRIKGALVIPSGNNVLSSNCVFINEENGSLEFENGASIVVKNSSFIIEDFMISTAVGKTYTSVYDSIVPYFVLESSELTMNNCQLAAVFEKNALAVEGNRSSVNIKGSIVSIAASSYGSFISGNKTDVNIENSSINVTADTCVTLSVNQGNVNLVNNSFKIIGQMGRIAEFFSVKGNVRLNNLKGDLKNSSSTKAVYTDKNCDVIQETNEYYGF